MTPPLLITGGWLIDPANGREGLFDLLAKNGKIIRVDKKIKPERSFKIFSVKGRWLLPGFIDAHVHLREPGEEESETIESGSQAAAAGGVTSLLAMANTKKPIDSPKQVRFILRRAKESSKVRIFPVGAVTKGLEGKELTDIPAMVQAGCRALSDDGHCVMNSQLLRSALKYSKRFGVPLIEHCEEENLSLGGAMNEGALSIKLGLGGIPTESESLIVARNIFLAQLTGAQVHCAHISTKDSVELIRNAKKKGIPITAETCPHYFSLTEDDVQKYGTLAKMKPPLRTKKDLLAIKEGLADGTINIIASDHAPHQPHSKNKKFSEAPFGVIGLETLFTITYNELVLKKLLSPLKAIQKLTENPAKIFHLSGGNLSIGSPADIVIFDPEKSWIIGQEGFFSKSSNSPFIGRKVQGKIVSTLVAGKAVFGSIQDEGVNNRER